MSTGYGRKRTYTPTRKRTAASRIRKIAKSLDMSHMTSKQSFGCLTHMELNTKTVGHAQAPTDAFGNHLGTKLGVPDNTALKMTYTQLMPNCWMGFGNLLSCIRPAIPGQVAKEFERGGDQIYLRNLEFHITAENKATYKQGGRFRFVVWKTNRSRDLTTSLDGGWNSGINRHSDMVIDNHPKARFSGPPLMQADFVGPAKAISNTQLVVESGQYTADSRFGNQDQIYPGPVVGNDYSGYIIGVNGLDAVIDKSRCTVLCDTTFELKPAPDSALCCPTAKYSKLVPFNKKISFSTEKTVSSIVNDASGNPQFTYVDDIVLDASNPNDYLNCAIVCVPNGSLTDEAKAFNPTTMDLDNKPAMANVRIELTSRWKDMNIMRTRQAVSTGP